MPSYKHTVISLCIALFSFFTYMHAYTPSEASAKKPRIGIFIFKLDDIYINSVAKHLEEDLQGKAEITIFDAKNDQTIQTEQLLTYLKQDISALAINLVDLKESQHIINFIRKKNIPTIFFNKEPNLAFLKNYENARYVGTDAEQSSFIQAEIITKLWKENPQLDRNNDGVCNFLMLQGGLDNPEALQRTRATIHTARALGLTMQQIGDTLICDWDAKCAYNAVNLALSVHKNEVDFIISNNDDMAIGAIKSLQEFGFNTKTGITIPVVGIDATEKAKAAITQGSMHGTVLQDADSMAHAVSGMLLNIIAGKPFLQDLPYSWDDTGISVRIPYKPHPYHKKIGNR